MGYKPPKEAIATATLTKPIKVMGEDVTELHFREADLGDFPPGMNLAEMEKEFTPENIAYLTSRLANVPLPTARKIKFGDIAAVMGALAEAIGPFGTSSEGAGGEES